MVRTVDIRLGKIKWDSQDCPDPIVKIAGAQNLAINCINDATNTYRVQTIDGSGLPNCITFVVTCGSCSTCPPQAIERCLCDSQNPCTEPCTECINNICVPRCAPEDCINGRCVDCKSNSDCPCNQVCTPSGCACPPNTSLNPITKCCDECATDRDCGPCAECVNINGAMTCVPIKCPDGVCDPATGNCVECLTSGDCANKECKKCDPVTKRCVAGPGQVQVGNRCVPEPDCITDIDCGDPCLACGPRGNCIPITCPPGKVPVTIGNICKCVEQCDCDDPASCINPQQYCAAVDVNVCGCLPCQGDCTTGCKPPCYCNPIDNKCYANPCTPGPCTDGSECGPGCGCIGKECKPCSVLSCLTNECAQSFGCKCIGQICVADDCNNQPCTTFVDCPVGCTCIAGKCTGCSNFRCNPIDTCSQKPGCICEGGECTGDPDIDNACTDTLEITKDDQNCTLTGILTTENCCNCAPIANVIRGAASDNFGWDVEFKVELRKGDYVGGGGADLPLLDDIDHPDIAENDVPVSGTYRMLIRANVTETVNATNEETTIDVDYAQKQVSVDGTNATLNFVKVRLPKLDTPNNDGTVTKVYNSYTVIINLQAPGLTVSNNCTYRAPSQAIAVYNIYDNNDFTTGFAPKGKSVTSKNCRDPFFRWSKDGVIIRKRYVSLTSEGYKDVLTKLNTPELESCANYTLTNDCSCNAAENKNIIFCNPAQGDGNLQYKITDCGRKIEVLNFNPCDANRDLTFVIEADGLNNGDGLKFTGADQFPVIGTADKCMRTLTLGYECDTKRECSWTVQNTDCDQEEIILERKCDKGQLVVDIDYNNQAIESIEVIREGVGIYTISPSETTYTGLPGQYIFRVKPVTCDPYDIEFTEECCDHISEVFEWNCDNGTLDCKTVPGNVYLINGVVVADICQTLENTPYQDTTVTVVRDGCADETVIVRSLCNTSFCSSGPPTTRVVPQNDASVYLTPINFPDGNRVTVTADSPEVIIQRQIDVSGDPTDTYRISNFTPNKQYIITTRGENCTNIFVETPIRVNVTQEDCDLEVGIQKISTAVNPVLEEKLTAVIPSADPCPCIPAEWHVRASVEDTDDPNQIDVRLYSDIKSTDSKPVIPPSTIILEVDGVETDLETVFLDDQSPLNKNLLILPRGTEEEIEIAGYSITFNRNQGVNNTTVVVSNFQYLNSNTIPPEVDNIYVTINGIEKEYVPGQTMPEYPFCCPQRSFTFSVRMIIDGVEYESPDTMAFVDLDCAPTGGIEFNPCFVIYSFTLVTKVQQGGINKFKLKLRNLELDDNCEYENVEQTFTVTEDLKISPSLTQIILPDIKPGSERYTKFSWYENKNSAGTYRLIDTGFGLNSHDLSIKPDHNSSYRVIAQCTPCDAADNLTYCYWPEINLDLNVDTLTVTGSKASGVYDIRIYNNNTIVGINSFSLGMGNNYTANVSFQNLPTDSVMQVLITEAGDDINTAPCKLEFEISTKAPLPRLSYTGCDGAGLYDVKISNFEPDWSVVIDPATSGTLDQTDNSWIRRVDQTNPAVITVTGSNRVPSLPTVLLQDCNGPSSQIPPSPSSSNRKPSSVSTGMPSTSSSADGTPCNTGLVIEDQMESCTYTTSAVNPNNFGSTLMIDNSNFIGTARYNCVTFNSCSNNYESIVPAAPIQWKLIDVFTNTSNIGIVQKINVEELRFTVDGVNPESFYFEPGRVFNCQGCLPFDGTHLNYRMGDDPQPFVDNVYAYIHNRFIELGYTDFDLTVTADYARTVDVSVAGIKFYVGLGFKGDGSVGYPRFKYSNGANIGSPRFIVSATGESLGLVVWDSIIAAPNDDTMDFVTNSLGWVRAGNSLHEWRIDGIRCTDVNGCDTNNAQYSAIIYVNADSGEPVSNSPGLVPASNPDVGFTAGPASATCTHVRLIATLTGEPCPGAVYQWTGPDVPTSNNLDEIFVPNNRGSEYRVFVTGCAPACGTLTRTHII